MGNLSEKFEKISLFSWLAYKNMIELAFVVENKPHLRLKLKKWPVIRAERVGLSLRTGKYSWTITKIGEGKRFCRIIWFGKIQLFFLLIFSFKSLNFWKFYFSFNFPFSSWFFLSKNSTWIMSRKNFLAYLSASNFHVVAINFWQERKGFAA